MAAIWNFHGHSVRHLLKKIRSFDRDGDALKRISLLAIGYWLLAIAYKNCNTETKFGSGLSYNLTEPFLNNFLSTQCNSQE